MGSVGSYISSKLSNIENVSLILLAIFLYIFKVIISLRGINTPWYRSLDGTQFINPYVSGGTWFFAYVFSILGIVVLSFQKKGFDTVYIGALYLLGLLMSFFWDIIFFYGRDIKFSLLIYLFLSLYYAWFFYAVYQISVTAALFQLPLVIRTLYFFIQVGILFLYNPGDTIIPD